MNSNVQDNNLLKSRIDNDVASSAKVAAPLSHSRFQANSQGEISNVDDDVDWNNASGSNLSFASSLSSNKNSLNGAASNR